MFGFGSSKKKEVCLVTDMATIDKRKVQAKILIKQSGVLVQAEKTEIFIAFEFIQRLLMKDETTEDYSMGGYCIEYSDDAGHGKLMFHNSNMSGWKRTKEHVETIRSAHAEYFKGCNIENLEVIHVGAKPTGKQALVYRS